MSAWTIIGSSSSDFIGTHNVPADNTHTSLQLQQFSRTVAVRAMFSAARGDPTVALMSAI